ncbi:hypothetical protein NQ117_22055 [Paenibacillus sp. SC116]|uniref:YncE family protein n=1 Tax=Paenibacillus sp. SC116 TaxID=2968986 RepID=UPI00215A3440|nr:hypothetical protein [Paenibacillus sp. SC116]MCR8846373.1 hypothetical protein [Paenibacillus sp. SC116]
MKLWNRLLTTLLLVLFLSSCGSEVTTDPKGDIKALLNESIYDIYLNTGGNLTVAQVLDIGTEHAKISTPVKIKIRDDGGILHSIESVGDKKIYASIYDRTGGRSDKRIKVFQEGVQSNVINTNMTGPNRMIWDEAYGKMYVAYAFTPKKDGIPMAIIDTKLDKEIGKVMIKGAALFYKLHGDYLYVIVTVANKMGYKDVPDNYILSINRITGQTQIVGSTGKLENPKGLAVNDKGIFVITIKDDPTDFKTSKLKWYSTSGDLVSEFPLDPGARDIVINNQGTAYISHNDKSVHSDMNGSQITVFDTKNKKLISKLKGFKSPTELVLVDQYLFVLNDRDSSISIVNTNSNKVIETIKMDSGMFPASLEVIKQK